MLQQPAHVLNWLLLRSNPGINTSQKYYIEGNIE